MKALTLWQPYATLIAVGAKTIETRSSGTTYRGPLAIHAAKRWDRDTADECKWHMEDLAAEAFAARPFVPLSEAHTQAGKLPWRDTLGCIVAVADLVDCRPMLEAPDRLNYMFGCFGPGRWGWVLACARPLLPPLPCRGAQGLWVVPADVLARLDVA